MWRRKDSDVNRRTVIRESNQACSMEGCTGKCRSKGLCGKHYYEAFLLDHGDKIASMENSPAAPEPVRMNTGELRIDYIRKRVAELNRARKRKLAKAKKDRQKYDYLADTVNQNDTEWGENEYE
jgi:hypothetical protein